MYVRNYLIMAGCRVSERRRKPGLQRLRRARFAYESTVRENLRGN